MFIYKIINLINNKIYIGKTEKTIEDGYNNFYLSKYFNISLLTVISKMKLLTGYTPSEYRNRKNIYLRKGIYNDN
jgi:hypothetical protein